MKKLILSVVMLAAFSGSVYADQHSIGIGYAQSKVDDFKNINGVNANYRYEWDNTPISFFSTLSYMSGDKSYNNYSQGSYFDKTNVDVKYFSILLGPAYRINEYVSLYGVVGVSRITVKVEERWNLGGYGVGVASGSDRSTGLAWGAGVIVNPVDNLSVYMGYEGSRARGVADSNYGINGFNVGVGYTF